MMENDHLIISLGGFFLALGKQSKILSDRQVSMVLNHLAGTRYSQRDRVMLLLSVKAGLRTKEIALLTWDMVCDANGEVADCIALHDVAAKSNSGRIIPVHRDLMMHWSRLGHRLKSGGHLMDTSSIQSAVQDCRQGR